MRGAGKQEITIKFQAADVYPPFRFKIAATLAWVALRHLMWGLLFLPGWLIGGRRHG